MKPDARKPDRKQQPERTRSVRVPRLYRVVVECASQHEQRRVYELLAERGIDCRLLTL